MPVPRNYPVDEVFRLAGFPYGRPTGANRPQAALTGNYHWDILVTLFSNNAIDYIADNFVAELRTPPTGTTTDTIFDHFLAAEFVERCIENNITPLGRIIDVTDVSIGDIRYGFADPRLTLSQMQNHKKLLRERAVALINEGE